MITAVQLKKLQSYAREKNEGIRLVNEEDTKRIRVFYSDKQYICLSNKSSSMLTMKSVKYHIDKCAELWAKEQVNSEGC